MPLRDPMFDQPFYAIDNALRSHADCGTESDYAEQTSWLLLNLDGLEMAASPHQTEPQPTGP